MNKLSAYLRPAYLLCLLGLVHYFRAQQAVPLAVTTKDLVTGKASLLRRPASNPGVLTHPFGPVPGTLMLTAY